MRTKAVLWGLGGLGIAAIMACSTEGAHDHGDGGTHAAVGPNCQAIVDACHHVDTGEGKIAECHLLAHEATADDQCAGKRAECVQVCEAAEGDGGSHAHGDSGASDAGHGEDGSHNHHSSDAGDGGTKPMSISFAARVGASPFSCASTFSLGTPATMVEPLDFRLYVSDVRLVKSDGSEVPVTLTQDAKWQYQNVALLDFEDKTGSCANGTVDRNPTISGTAPSGTYNGVHFTLGVPFALNHADVTLAPSPLNLSGLFWSWNSGYKFLRLDGRAAGPDGGTSVFNIHLGSTDCTGDAQDGGVQSCGRPTRGDIKLTGFDPLTKTILVDWAALVAANNLAVNAGGAPGCMSGSTDPECPAILTRLGIDPNTGGPNAATQAFFRVE